MSFIAQASVPQHFHWLKARTGCSLDDGFRAVEVVDATDTTRCEYCDHWHGRIRGVVGFGGWTPNGVLLHIAVDTVGALRRLIPAAFHYAFVDAGRKIASAIVVSDNVKSLRLTKHAGFRIVHVQENGWSDGVHMVFQEMRREECRWLKENAHG